MADYKNIVFDMGRVLTDYTADNATRAYTSDPEVIREVNLLVYHSGEWTMLDAGLMQEEEALRKMMERASSDQARLAVKSSFESWDKYNLTPHAGMGDLVRDLKKAGKKVYILSNVSVRLDHDEWKKHVETPELFDGAFLSAPHRVLKPQHQIYEMFLQEYRLKASDCVFIDDLSRNVRAAVECGFGGYVFDGDVEKLRTFLNL
ncbi:MAG: HAD family hydrolase [Bilifractor sp.]